MLAAGLHPRVRSSANGWHNTRRGSMAAQTVVDRRRSVVLPAGSDAAAIAAAMNPAMSSWLALRARIAIQPGQEVLVLGATGNAGRIAVEIAQRLGTRSA